jgi:hypothetical protein
MGGAALAALAHKLIKKPVLTFENPESKLWDLRYDYNPITFS